MIVNSKFLISASIILSLSSTSLLAMMQEDAFTALTSSASSLVIKEKAISYQSLSLMEFNDSVVIELYTNVKNPLSNIKFKNYFFEKMREEKVPFTLKGFEEYLTQQANTLYYVDAPLVLKFPHEYTYLGMVDGKSLCLNNKLYEEAKTSLNYRTQINFVICKEMAEECQGMAERYYGLKASPLSLYGTNTLLNEHFPNPDEFQAHAIAGQTLQLKGSFGQIMKKAITLDDLRVGELSVFQGYLLTPPQKSCHGGAVVLIPTTGNIDPGLISHAQWLTSKGFITFLADTFYGNNVVGGLKNALESSMQNEVITAFRARQILCSHPYVNKNLVGIGGFSRGGTVADLTSREEFYAMHSHDGLPFAFEYGYYPSIILQQLDLKVSPSPKLYLTGDQDPFVDIQVTQKYMQRLKDADIDAELKVYQGASHAFDATEPWENTEFPIIGNEKVNLYYGENGFIPADAVAEGIKAQQPWDALPEYLISKVKFGYSQIPNPEAEQQAQNDLLSWFANKVGISFR